MTSATVVRLCDTCRPAPPGPARTPDSPVAGALAPRGAGWRSQSEDATLPPSHQHEVA